MIDLKDPDLADQLGPVGEGVKASPEMNSSARSPRSADASTSARIGGAWSTIR